MGKAPALAPCLFCNELPCVCAKRTRVTAAKPRTRVAAAPDVPAAPVASRRRFDATDAMRIAAVDSPLVARVPPSPPRPSAPVRARVSAPDTIAPARVVAPVEADSIQAQRDSDIMNYAVHLIRVGLGGRLLDEKASNGALERRAALVRSRLHRP